MKNSFPFIKLAWVLSCCLLFFSNCQSDAQPMESTKITEKNRLSETTSPYLIQHANNPVNWWPWNEKALRHAQDKNKLIIVSIGYSSCHWCHVMEHESFESEEVAEVMNRSFVSIKVDREERPDIDQIYMDAAHLITGRGGWPLNVICTPDGNPVYAGTYFPKEKWIRMLDYFSDLWQSDPTKLIDQGKKIKQGIKEIQQVPQLTEDSNLLEDRKYDKAVDNVLSGMDKKYGGRNGAPKFPMPSIYEWLLSHSYYKGDSRTQKITTTTLDRMALGGIYDAIGGGFSRYSTDQQWHIPHFEKMLYDNGQLLSLYAKQYKVTKDENYKRIIEECYSYITEELMDKNGLFYSSYDADSEGEEGKYYKWTYDEIKNLLDEKAFNEFVKYYKVKKAGNWEHGYNVFIANSFLRDFAKKENKDYEELSERMEHSKKTLNKARNQRIKPSLDDKSILSWNALMIMGLIDMYEATGEDKYFDLAQRSMNFIDKKLKTAKGGLLRIHHRNKTSIAAFLDDYGLVIRAKIKLYENSFDEKWLKSAMDNLQYVLKNFSDPEGHMFFYNDVNSERLIVRKKEVSDNVIPASNSVMAQNLFLLGHIYYKQEYIDQSLKMLVQMTAQMEKNPSFHSNWMQLYLWSKYGIKEVAISGPSALELRKELAKEYYPNAIFIGDVKGKASLELLEMKYSKELTRIFVCRDKACLLPTSDVEVAGKLIRE